MRHLDLPERFEIVIAWDSFFHLKPDVLHRVEDPDCGGHTIWLAQLRGEES
jgi:hypothetical protein